MKWMRLVRQGLLVGMLSLSVLLRGGDQVSVVRPGADGVMRWLVDRDLDPDPELEIAFGLVGDRFVFGDWNTDGVGDVGIVRAGNDGLLHWYLDTDRDPEQEILLKFGFPSDRIVVGDWTGTGMTHIGIVRNGSDGFLHWYFDTDGDPEHEILLKYGWHTDQVITGDWTGDGTTNIGIVREGNDGLLHWYLDTDGDPEHERLIRFGFPGDRVVAGDWQGTGVSQVGVVRESPDGFLRWYLDFDSDIHADRTFLYGLANDEVVVGDWSQISVGPEIEVSGLLSGIGVLDFGTSVFGNPGDRKSIAIRNQGFGVLEIRAIDLPKGILLGGKLDLPFAIPAGQNQVVELVQDGYAVGSRSGAVMIHSNDPHQGTYVIAVAGEVTAAVVSASGTALDFGLVKEGEYSDGLELTLANSGAQALSIDRVVFPEGIALSTTTPLLLPGQTQILSAKFLGLEPGDHNGTIEIYTNDPVNSPLRVDYHASVASSDGLSLTQNPSQLRGINLNGRNLLTGGGVYLIGSIDGFDDPGTNIHSYGNPDGVMRNDAGLEGPRYSLTFDRVDRHRIRFRARVQDVPFPMDTLSLPFDFDKTLFEEFAFDGQAYRDECQERSFYRSGNRYENIAACHPIVGGDVGVAIVNPGGRWAAVRGWPGEVRVVVQHSDHLRSLRFHRHPGTHNLEFDFGRIVPGETAAVEGVIIITATAASPELPVDDQTFEAESELLHQTGHRDGDGWAAHPANDRAGFLTYGPYRSFPSEDFAAVFRLQSTPATVRNHFVATLEVYDAENDRVLSQRELYSRDFKNQAEPVEFALPFRGGRGQVFEFRIYWQGETYLWQDWVRIEGRTDGGTPPPRQFRFEAEADLAHQIGRLSGDGWEADTTRDDRAFMAYGPYTEQIPAGAWRARFRALVDNHTADDLEVITIEVYDATSQRMLNQRTLRRRAFEDSFRYQDFDLRFQAAGEERLEFRVFWHDHSYVRFDSVTVEADSEVTTRVRGEESPALLPATWSVDLDADGQSNLLEYITGTDPSLPNDARVTALLVDLEGTLFPAIRVEQWRVPKGAAIEVEVSDDLMEWRSGPEHTKVVEDELGSLVVRSTRSVSADPRQFLRVITRFED